MSSITNPLEGKPPSKNKRRSKNDTKNRDYKCGCGKNYLSYPALYTHIKQKHGGVYPPGTQLTQQKSSRGRGRPRKIYIAEDTKTQQDKEYEADKLKKMENEKHDRTFFMKFGAYGGPSNPREWFTSDSENGEPSKVSKLHVKLIEYLKK